MSNNNDAPLTEAVYYILLSLTKQMHGYGIIQNVKEMTGGRLVLAAGTLYGAITNLLSKGWIVAIDSRDDGRKKEYIITAVGRTILDRELSRLCELTENGKKLLGKADE